MKKLLIVLAALLALSLVSACAEEGAVRVSAFSGPTGMGMAVLMDADENGTSKLDYDFTIAGSPDQVTPLLVKGELDIACVPANLGAVLYNKTNGGVRVLAVNTLGVLYILSHSDEIRTVDDLRGRTLYASGKGSTPEYALSYILSGSGLADGDVNVEWKSEHAEALTAFMQDKSSAALLPQPFVTVAQSKADDISIAIDLNTAWESVTDESVLITGCVIARTAFIEEHPDLVKTFLEEYAASVAATNEDITGSSALIGKYGIVDAAVAEKAIPYCHIVCIAGQEMTQMLPGYLSVLFDAEPASVGGALPAEDYYYTAD